MRLVVAMAPLPGRDVVVRIVELLSEKGCNEVHRFSRRHATLGLGRVAVVGTDERNHGASDSTVPLNLPHGCRSKGAAQSGDSVESRHRVHGIRDIFIFDTTVLSFPIGEVRTRESVSGGFRHASKVV